MLRHNNLPPASPISTPLRQARLLQIWLPIQITNILPLQDLLLICTTTHTVKVNTAHRHHLRSKLKCSINKLDNSIPFNTPIVPENASYVPTSELTCVGVVDWD
jgi:hypothetical protein